MRKHRYRKVLAALVLAACLWALPAAAQSVQPTAPPAAAADNRSAAANEATAGQAEGSLPGGLSTTTGGAALVGVGAYSFMRKQRQDERERRRAEPREVLYFENHTRNGTLRPEERDELE